MNAIAEDQKHVALARDDDSLPKSTLALNFACWALKNSHTIASTKSVTFVNVIILNLNYVEHKKKNKLSNESHLRAFQVNRDL